MDMKQLQYFLALTKHEHMSSTADILNISQPALSKSIARLEDEVGVKLFDRHGNHIRLNKHGELFAEYVEASMDILYNGLFSAMKSKYDTKGSIHISCHIFSDSITKCALEYTELNPDVRLIVEHAPLRENENSSDKIDFILCSNHNSESIQPEHTWITQPLLCEEFYFLISPRYREYPDSVTSLNASELKEDCFITMPQINIFFSDITFKICQSAGYTPKSPYQTNDFLVKCRMIGEGLAIGVMPACCIEAAKSLYPGIRQFKIENYDTKRTISLMRRKKVLMSEAALDFWDFVWDYFQLDDNSEE